MNERQDVVRAEVFLYRTAMLAANTLEQDDPGDASVVDLPAGLVERLHATGDAYAAVVDEIAEHLKKSGQPLRCARTGKGEVLIRVTTEEPVGPDYLAGRVAEACFSYGALREGETVEVMNGTTAGEPYTHAAVTSRLAARKAMWGGIAAKAPGGPQARE